MRGDLDEVVGVDEVLVAVVAEVEADPADRGCWGRAHEPVLRWSAKTQPRPAQERVRPGVLGGDTGPDLDFCGRADRT